MWLFFQGTFENQNHRYIHERFTKVKEMYRIFQGNTLQDQEIYGSFLDLYIVFLFDSPAVQAFFTEIGSRSLLLLNCVLICSVFSFLGRNQGIHSKRNRKEQHWDYKKPTKANRKGEREATGQFQSLARILSPYTTHDPSRWQS